MLTPKRLRHPGCQVRSRQCDRLADERYRLRATFSFLLILLAPQFSSIAAQDAPSATPLAFVGARIIDGTGAPPLADAVMVVQDGKIAAIGTAASVKIPPAATRVNVAGRTIMPGMINAHGHVNDVRGLKASQEFYAPSTSSISSASTRATASRPCSASAAMVRRAFRFVTRRHRVSRASLSQGP